MYPAAFWSLVRIYKNALDEKCVEELEFSALTARRLPQCKATMERIFLHVKDVETEVRNRLTIGLLSVAIIRIKTSLHFCSNCCRKFTMLKRMLNLFNNSEGASTSINTG